MNADPSCATNKLALLAGWILALAFSCALLVLPAGQAFADTGYCIDCNRVTTGTYSYDASYAVACYPPTCTEDGLACFVCGECGNVNRPTTVPALGHDHRFSYSTATCASDGQNVYVCSRCGDTYTEWTSALGHDYYLTTVEATCTEQGANTYTCSRCGSSYSDPIAALGHDYIETTTEPTCTEKGESVSTCSRCGDTHSETIAALGHDMKELAVVPATCTDAGSRTLVCQRCNAEEHKAIAALGHSWPETWTVEKEATVFEEGLESRTCQRCGLVEQRAIEKLSLIGTPIGSGITIGLGLVVIGCIAFGLKKYFAAKAAATASAATVAAAAAQTAAAAVPDHFDLIRLSERTIFAKLEDDPANEEFLDLVKSRPNLSLVLFDAEKGTSLSEQIGDVAPDAVLLDFSGEEGFGPLEETIRQLRADHEEVKFEAIAFDADERLRTKLAEAKDGKKLFAFSLADANKYVKMSELVVPLYKDLMKEAGTLEDIGTIADLFGIPAVSTMLGIVAKAERVEKVASTAKDAFEGEDLELSDGISVTSNIANLLGLDELGMVATLVGSATDTRDLLDSDEEGATHATYKASTIAEDVHDAVKGLMKK